MFICRACARRTYPTIFRRGLAVEGPSLASRLPIPSYVPRRTAATRVARVANVESPPEAKRLAPRDASEIDWAVTKALRHIKDPYRIAEYVEQALQKNRYDEALLMARKASKNAQVPVSWNHLIGYELKNQRLHSAIKLYNEMKKRAQLPNAQTYTIIFRGCAESRHPKLAVAEASRIYYSMLNSDRLKPSIIHLNAVLLVCARAGDFDSLFNLVKTANDSIRSPNNLTYTTLLNALRVRPNPHQQRPADDNDVPSDQDEVKVSITRAKAIWEEVITRWRQGLVTIDEGLVCAMGRVLSTGGYHDNNDILSLIDQTMAIPRLDKDKLAKIEPSEKTADPVDSESTPDLVAAPESVSPPDPVADQETTSPQDPVAVSEATSTLEAVAIQGFKPVGLPLGIYALPGRNSLSLVLTSLAETRKSSYALQYWNVFVKRGVEPDSENYYRLLKALRLGHASAKVAEVMKSMPVPFMQPKTFRIAMSACAHDNLNPNIFANAGQILDIMNKNLRTPDVRTLDLYLTTVMRSDRQLGRPEAAGGSEEAKYAFGRLIIRGLDRLWEPLRLATNALTFGEQNLKYSKEYQKPVQESRMETLKLARRMMGLSDKLVTEVMAEPAVIQQFRVRRNLLNRQIQRFYYKLDGSDGRSVPRPGRDTEVEEELGALEPTK